MATPVQADDPLVGRLLEGRYRLTSLLARGGMATVYVGVDERLDRPVAVKVMHRALADDPDFVSRFTREARSAARLSAPEVVAVYDTGRDEQSGAPYLVMEHVEGRDLRALLRQRGALPPGRALSLLEPVLRALAAAHRAGIVHRDVKPENVLLGDDGRVKVADFGLARAVASSELTSTTGLLIGTVAYLAPEQIETGSADARTDVYAAGVVLWEALTGAPPYAGDTPMQVAYRHVHDDVPAPSTVRDGIPPALDDLVVRATRRDPAERPPDGAAFLSEVRALREELDGQVRGRHDTLVAPLPARRADPPPAAPSGAAALGRVRQRRGPGRGDVPGAGSTALAPSPAAPRRRGRRRRALLAWLLVLLLGGAAAGGGWWLGAGRFTRAPALLTMPQAQAEEVLARAGLGAAVQEGRFDETVPAGQVLDQEPDPGDRVRKDGSVEIVLSRGPDRRAVPADVVGSPRQEAVEAVEAVGLRVAPGVVEEFSAQPAGVVLRTDPPVGQPLRPDSVVTLVVSKGVEQLRVPDVRERTRADAVARLEAAGFTATVETAFSDTVEEGVVIQQSPARGTAGRGSAVALVVSKGPDVTEVPGLAGLTRDEAQARLQEAGLRGRAVDLPDGGGRVVTQSPSPGTTVRRGSTITFYVL